MDSLRFASFLKKAGFLRGFEEIIGDSLLLQWIFVYLGFGRVIMLWNQLLDKLLDDVERNKGNWNSRGMAILGVDSSVICLKGDVPREFIDYYMKFPISEMHEGDSIHNKNSFLMRITDKTAVLQ